MKKLYKEEQVKNAIKKLEELLPDKDLFNGHIFQKFYKTKISEDFTRKDLKRIIVAKCEFEGCSLKAVAATGSKFAEVEFNRCDFSGANFQYCYFNKSHFFNDTLIKGANFSHSIFIDCVFDSITILESTLFDCYFENCIFKETTIKSDTFENSKIYNCNFENIDLAHLNLEYTQVHSVHMHNVDLPPYQIPYIIGLPTYLNTTGDNVCVYNDKSPLDKAAYCKLFDELAMYFYEQGEHFPLANIYIAQKKHELALECIHLGIREACDYFDFRMVKHLCKLACSNEAFSHSQLKELYDVITDLSYDNTWDLNTLHSYLLNIGEIRELLLNNSTYKERVEFVIKTNIDKDDLSSVNNLYNQINEIIRDNCSTSHIDSIELRHNSPYELYVICIDAPFNIFNFVISMYGIFAMGSKFVSMYKNFEETRRVHQQNELYKYELEEKKLDIEIKRKQLEKLEEEISKKQTGSSSGIYVVNEIEHNLRCSSLDRAQNIAPEYLHYKYSKVIPEQ